MCKLGTAHYFRSIIFAVLTCWQGTAVAGVDEGIAAYGRRQYDVAFREFQPLAEKGDAKSQFYLGRMHSFGRGTPRDELQAVFWYGKAADQGYADAQFQLGIAYSNGYGVVKDERKAAIWYSKAANQGDAIKQYLVGQFYLYVRHDDEQALFWFGKSANQGYAEAQYMLGGMYANGKGTAKDDRQAFFWYRKVADKGYIPAEYIVGYMYEYGQGVPKNEKQAVFWYRKAAEKGHADAQYSLGMLYVLGQGVPQDFLQAYFWQLLASAQGNVAATKQRDVVEAKLSPSQRATVQAVAQTWKPENPLAWLDGIEPGTSGSGSPTFTTATETQASPTTRRMSPDSTGSGFFIAAGSLITNAHVVNGCMRVTVSGQGIVTVSAVDARSDLALLTTKITKSSFASLRAGRLRQGESVMVVGYPLRGILATGPQVTTGNVSALAGMQNDSRFIQISAPVQPGNSGGPLVDASGNVAGVVVSKLNAMKIAEINGDIPQNVNFAVSPLVLQGFLDANGVNYQSAQSNKNLATTDVADIAKGYTVLVECWK